MCGIVAAASRSLAGRQIEGPQIEGLGLAARGLVMRGLEALAHRGPDGQGIYESPDQGVVLGHRRLAIVDLEGGAQPIANEDGTVQAVVNGEVYDDDSLRRDLEARGHVFRSRSDSELLVHLYEEHGEDCLHRLNGEFAFALWDGAREVLFAARDRFGVKPLHYAWLDDRLLLASEAKALFAMGVPARWDLDSLRSAFSLQYLPMGRSLFEGVRQLAPGAALRWKAGRLEVRRWWSLGDAAAPTSRAGESAVADHEGLGPRLDRAVRRRLRSDVPVAFALSGGIDSAAIAALAARQLGAIDAFTVCFEGAGFDETAPARATAEHLGARWHPVRATAAELLEALPAAVASSESLTINGQLPAKHLLNRSIRSAGFPVVLTGEGADECLLGYPHLRQDAGLDAGQRAALSAGILHAVDPPPLPRVAARWGYVPAFLAAKVAFARDLAPAWRRENLADPLLAFLDAMEEDDPARAPAQRSADLWTRTCLADYILRALGDGAEMAAGVEGRPPFLDHELFGWIRSLPVDARLGPGLEKQPLRRAVADLLPEAVVARGKQPFLSPPLLRTPPGREFACDLLTSQDGRALPLLDTTRIDVDRTAEPALLLVLSAILLQRAHSLGVP